MYKGDVKMQLKDKLRYIQEGYTIEQINSKDFKPILFSESINMDQIVMESFMFDLNIISESAMDYIIESNTVNKFIDHIRKIFNWMREKINQFINFVSKKISISSKKNAEIMKAVDSISKEAKATNQGSKEDAKTEAKLRNYTIKVHKRLAQEWKSDFVKDGFKKVESGIVKYMNTIYYYLDEPEKLPEVIEKLNDKNAFLKSIFNSSLSVNFDKEEITKKIYGEIVDHDVNINFMSSMSSALDRLNNQVFEFLRSIEESRVWLDSVEKDSVRMLNIYKVNIDDNDPEYIKKANLIKTAISKIIETYNIKIEVTNLFLEIHQSVINNLASQINKIHKHLRSN